MSKVSKTWHLLRTMGPAETAFRVADHVLSPFGIRPSTFRAERPRSVDHSEPQKIFDEIYLSNAWGSQESSSGAGSEVEYATPYREKLSEVITHFGVQSMFDAPCGDLNWIAPVIGKTGIRYIGGDISQVAIDIAKSRIPNIEAYTFDICSDKFPDVDVWHCRDCLFHLSFADIDRAIQNFLSSNIQFAFLTTHKALMMRNQDIPTGGFRFLDLEREPIYLPKPIQYIEDYRKGRSFPRFVGVWTKEQISAAWKNRIENPLS